MNILVTGAAGCAGLEICRELVQKGHSVTGMDNLTRPQLFGLDPNSEYAMAAGVRVLATGARFLVADFRKLYDPAAIIPGLLDFDCIVHAAAQTSHPRSLENPQQDFEINAIGTFRLLEMLRLERPKTRFLYISTSKVYGEYGDTACTERGTVSESCSLGDQTRMTPFGISKLTADLYVQEYARAFGLQTAVLRPNCITGGAGVYSTRQQNWIPQIVRACREGTIFPLYGHGGEQVRDVLHAKDLARAVSALLDLPRWNGEVYNVGGGAGNAIRMLDAIAEVQKRIGKKIEIESKDRRYGDWRCYMTDFAKLRDATGWQPKIGLDVIFDEACQ